jgi:hypothetical protein
MDQSAFDVFQTVKNYLYLGDFVKCCEEIKNMDINEDDLSQVIKKNFYYFMSLIESQKDEDINTLLGELKTKSEKQIKIYFNLFLFFVVYIYKDKFDQKKFDTFFNELKDVKRYDPSIFPAVYVIALMCLDREEYKNFLTLIEKFEGDIEILFLKFHLMLKMNKEHEMEKIVNSMELKESDSVITNLCHVIYDLYMKNDWDGAVNRLQGISKNNKVSPKLFNLIGVALMSKGSFEEAAKILVLGKETCENSKEVMLDYNSLLVNLICCYRNLGKEEEIRNVEEYLRKNDSENGYFERLNKFEQEFEKAVKG